ncbi:aspartyl/asparaginyl beta-hydroxylase domain-containing protein [Photorhabdus laumondii]|uniref:aspartyl/asparaginyl beta-hydroxylase domain-containing protein n=1 Tax=Photorhabdus laumondii TaxID=2218628 RepID=UPI0033160BB3
MLELFEDQLTGIREKYGSDCLKRVEDMFYPLLQQRAPLQADAKYIMPELSTTPWLDTNSFPQLQPLVTSLMNNADKIKQEINAVISGESQYITDYEHYLGTQKDWKALYLFKNGQPNNAVANILPATWHIFNNELRDWHCPLLEVHFSVLQPGTVIKPHCDLWNFTLNLHFAVDIPASHCEIIVANEARCWKEGECLLFDYSYQHEAYNRSDKHRICLLMDIWHPNLSFAEREALVLIITGIRKLFG